MNRLDYEEIRLKRQVFEMMLIAVSQLKKSKVALLNCDVELAEEILHTEEKVNSYELSIDRDCRNIIALQNLVASDFRFVMAIYKMNSEIERIADHAEAIAKFAIELDAPFKKKNVNLSHFEEMFDKSIAMFEMVTEAFENEDATLARKIFKKDKILNEIYKDAANSIIAIVKDSPSSLKHALFIFSTIKKLERIGDLSKNIAEEIIYYMEAKVIKHKDK